jgi:hypothetical protein
MVRRLIERILKTVELRQELAYVKAKNKILISHWQKLCQDIRGELDKDGWCRLVITSENLAAMEQLFENLANDGGKTDGGQQVTGS